MLFSCLAYIAFGLMYAYEEVLAETRTVIRTADYNFVYTEVVPQALLQAPYTKEAYTI